MTAIDVVFKKDRVHLLTDGAVYTGEGMPIGFMQKTMAIPPLNAAVAMQGTAFAVGYLAQAWASLFQSFDDMMERGEESLYYDYLLLTKQLGGDEYVKRFRIFVVGFSEAENKPKGFHFSNVTGEGIFEMLNSEPDEWYMVPSLSKKEEDNLESLNVLRNGYEFVGRFDPVRHGIPLMEAQRRMPIMPLGSLTEDEVPIVGGNILSTEISATGITQKVIHRWADDRFSAIEPDAFVAPKGVSHLAPPSNLSRQQRRALERLHGKVVA